MGLMALHKSSKGTVKYYLRSVVKNSLQKMQRGAFILLALANKQPEHRNSEAGFSSGLLHMQAEANFFFAGNSCHPLFYILKLEDMCTVIHS